MRIREARLEAEKLRRLFIDNALLLEQLRSHLLFIIPVGLAYTEDAERMPRLDESLLERQPGEEVAVASGGNIRNLFDLLRRAALSAEVRGGTSISFEDAEQAVYALRHDYVSRLGENPFDKASEISLDKKLQKLQAIYNGDAQAQIPDRVLYLLSSSASYFNSTGKAGTVSTPLVVDRLKAFGDALKPDAPGGTVFRSS